jgi:hypothetical protein
MVGCVYTAKTPGWGVVMGPMGKIETGYLYFLWIVDEETRSGGTA